MSDYLAMYAAIALTACISQIGYELSKIRKILEMQLGLKKADSDKKNVEAHE